jgi:hypothetical protein
MFPRHPSRPGPARPANPLLDQVLDLAAGRLLKAMKAAHGGSLASCVAFRPHRPWELLTGGLDCTVARCGCGCRVWGARHGRPGRYVIAGRKGGEEFRKRSLAFLCWSC